MTTRYDAIIIGAGIIGSATSCALARKGWRVLNIDKLPTCGYGSTSGSCAIIRPYYSTLDGSAMAYESHFYWNDWAKFIGGDDVDERGLARYINCGSLVMKTEQNESMASVCKLMNQLKSPYSELSPEEVIEKLPIMTMDSFAPAKKTDDPNFGIANDESLKGAVLFHAAGYVTDPQLATHNIMRAAEANGSMFRYNKSVSEVRQLNGKVCGITLDDGEHVDAPVVVNAAGPHSYLINELAGVEDDMNVKTRALRHEVAHVPMPDGFNGELDGCVTSDSDVGVYTRPELGNNLLIGSEDPAGDKRDWVHPDDFNKDFTEQWQTQVLRTCQRIPNLSVPSNPRGVVELYDVSDDWIPIYDKSLLPGFYMAIGTSGNQFKNAPIAGELMADIIDATEKGNNQDENPIDFHLKHIDYTLNSSFYSRLRQVNSDSSFSVLG